MMLVKYDLFDYTGKKIMENVTTTQIANMLHISKNYVTSCARNNVLIRGIYKVQQISAQEVSNKLIPCSMWEEWDRVVKPLNKALRNSGKDIKLTSIVAED